MFPQVRNLCYMVTRRERTKHAICKLQEQIFHLQMKLIEQELCRGRRFPASHQQPPLHAYRADSHRGGVSLEPAGEQGLPQVHWPSLLLSPFQLLGPSGATMLSQLCVAQSFRLEKMHVSLASLSLLSGSWVCPGRS